MLYTHKQIRQTEGRKDIRMDGWMHKKIEINRSIDEDG
jgi:hypothetical protein